MPSTTEPRSGLVYGWTQGENDWHTEMDNNLKSVGRFAYHLSVKDRNLATPPGTPLVGDAYIVATGGTGAWAGKDGQVAVRELSGWAFGVPRLGWTAYVEDEEKLIAYKAAGWSAGIAI